MEHQLEKTLFGKTVLVELSADEDGITVKKLENIYDGFEAHFTQEKLSACIEQTAQELIESIYQESDKSPKENELSDLMQDMALARITVYSDAFLLFFTAPKIFPGDEIVVQLDEHYEIEDMVFEEE